MRAAGPDEVAGTKAVAGPVHACGRSKHATCRRGRVAGRRSNGGELRWNCSDGCHTREQQRRTEGATQKTGGLRHRWNARPNVRAKRGPTAWCQAPATENVHRTCGRGLAPCRWSSA